MILKKKFIVLHIFILFVLFNCKIGKLPIKEEEKKSNKCLITFLDGKAYLVDVQYNNISELKVGLNVDESDIIKTEKDSTIELQIGDGSLVRVKENSVLKIVKLFKDQELEETKINLDIGKILAKPKNLTEGSSFEVETRSVTAGVRGTEFIVAKTEEGITKIAVNEGEVKVVKNLVSEDMTKIEKIDKGVAKNLDKILQEKIVLKKDEKLEVNDTDYNSYKEQTLSIIEKIAADMENNKDNKEKLESVKKEVEEKRLKEIQKGTEKVILKGKVTDKEWEKDFNKEEFKDMIITGSGKAAVVEKEEDKENKTVEKEDKIQVKQEEKKEDSKIVEKEDENQKEVTVVEKAVNDLGITFSEKNTAITVVDKYICITNGLDKTVYFIDPEKAEVLWKFTRPDLNKVQSPAISFKNKIILATYNNILVLNNNGKILLSKEISNGPLYWSSPIKYQNNLFIPTARYLYYYNGQTINQINEDEFPVAQSQLYISSDTNTIFAVDSLSCCIIGYDFVNKKVQWNSDKLPNNIFTPPVKSGKYLIAADIKQNLYRFDYQSKNTKPDILNIDNGVLSNILPYGNNIYFVAKDGIFYNVNVNNFNKAKMIMRIDRNPVQDKYLTKKLFIDNKVIYFASDTGKIFIYDISTGNADFISIEENKDDTALIGTPVKINKAFYFVDLKSNIYKMYKK